MLFLLILLRGIHRALIFIAHMRHSMALISIIALIYYNKTLQKPEHITKKKKKKYNESFTSIFHKKQIKHDQSC